MRKYYKAFLVEEMLGRTEEVTGGLSDLIDEKKHELFSTTAQANEDKEATYKCKNSNEEGKGIKNISKVKKVPRQ